MISNSPRVKNSFTLFELLIVLVLVIVIYSLSFSLIPEKETPISEQTLTIDNLYPMLKSLDKTEIRLECIEEVEKCKLYTDDKEEEIDFTIPETNQSFGYILVDERVRKRTFLYMINANGYGSQIIFSKNNEMDWYRLNPLGDIYPYVEEDDD